MATPDQTVLFAGGGTGGHLFPGLAVAEVLVDQADAPRCHFACSDRAIDTRLLGGAGVAFTPLHVQPWPRRPWDWPSFLGALRRARRESARLIGQQRVGLVVALGGFVSGPVVSAARRGRHPVPSLLVNLDAVPGRANRLVAGMCDRVCSVHVAAGLPAATETVAMPLRRCALSAGDRAADRAALGLESDVPVLLVTGASQGARSINCMMIELASRAAFQEAVTDWQILHLAGEGEDQDVAAAYGSAGIRHRVMGFCDQMGRAWGASDLAISRAGAGSVAEAGANTVPTIFFPYPHHRDQHQRLNAAPLVDAGGAELAEDLVDAAANAQRWGERLTSLLGDADRRQQMRRALADLPHARDGAEQVANRIMQIWHDR